MSKLEKIVVSTDPESAALIEEIQNSVYDRLLDAVAESLPKATIKASVSAVDITPVLDNQRKIMANQKLILDALNGNAGIASLPKKGAAAMGNNSSRSKFPQRIELWTKSGRCIKSIYDSGEGIYCTIMDNNLTEKRIYVADSKGQPYGVNGNELLPGKQDCPISAHDIKGCYVIFNLNANKFEIIEL